MFKLPEGYSQEPFDDPEPLDEEYVLNALLGYNYLPNQKSDCDELLRWTPSVGQYWSNVK